MSSTVLETSAAFVADACPAKKEDSLVLTNKRCSACYARHVKSSSGSVPQTCEPERLDMHVIDVT